MRAASLVVLVTIALPLVLGQFWSYQLGLYALYAIGRDRHRPVLGPGGIFAARPGDVLWPRRPICPALPLSPFVNIRSLQSCFAVCRAGFAGFWRICIGARRVPAPGESGAYFSMITLALTLLAFQIATSWNSVTGGFDGLKGIPGLPGLDDFSDVYYVSAAVLLRGAGDWPAGSTPRRSAMLWRALAQNERRLQPLRLRHQPAQIVRLRRQRDHGGHSRRDLCARSRASSRRRSSASACRPIS